MKKQTQGFQWTEVETRLPGKLRLHISVILWSVFQADAPFSAVVCRELIDPQEIFSLKPEPVLICNSLPCPEKLKCLVIEAARATSAAPTYFPPQIINQRCFIDGAVEYNNPSMATWDHYTVKSRIAALPRTSQHPNTELYHYHGNLNTSMLRFINLGTGDKHKRIRSHRRFTLAPLVPDNVMRLYYLGEIITDKFDTQKIASKMEKLALTSRGSDTYDFTWHRFSADNRVGYVKLDNHRALRRIERSTLGYLAKSETQEKLNRVAKKIAKDYLQEHGQPHIADAEAVIDNTRVDNTAPHEDSMSLGDTTSSNDTTPLLKKTFIVPTTPIADVEPRVSQMPVNETPNSQLIPDPGLSSASSNNPTTPSGPGTSPKTPENSRSVPAPFEAIREFEDEEPSPSWRKRPDAGNDGIVFTDAALEDPSVTAELDALRSSKSSLSFDDRLRAVEAPSRPSERTTESDQSH